MNPLAKLIYKYENTSSPEQSAPVSSELFIDVASERTNKIRVSLLTAEQIDGITFEEQPVVSPVTEAAIVEQAPAPKAVEPVAQVAVGEVMNSEDASITQLDQARRNLQAVWLNAQNQDDNEQLQEAA